MWINQPSTHQKDHKFHGKNVLVSEDELKSYDDIVDAYFVEGDIVSSRIYRLALDEGWK